MEYFTKLAVAALLTGLATAPVFAVQTTPHPINVTICEPRRNQGPLPAYAPAYYPGTALARCVPLRITYADGTTWRNPHLPRLERSIYEHRR